MSKITLLRKTGIASILMFIVLELCQYPSRFAQCKGSSTYKTEVLLRIHHPRIAKAMTKTNVWSKRPLVPMSISGGPSSKSIPIASSLYLE